jgi:glycosyltransferase involved in cell wall biosynthesis
MKLLIVFDHRFFRRDAAEAEAGATNPIFSAKSYGHSFFAKRYGRVFDDVAILARLATAPADAVEGEPTEGPGVRVVPLGDWQGPRGLLAAWRRIGRVLDAELASADAVLLIAPGMLATLAHRRLLRAKRAYGVEVVSDPYDAMAPSAMRHPLRPLLRWSATRQLQRLCATAAAASYVTRETLQRRYPCPAYSVGVSDVELPALAFADDPRPLAKRGAPRTIVTVGTMSQPYKAQDVLIDALAACRRNGLDLRAILVGDGRHRAELERRASLKKVSDAVTFAGALPAGEAIRGVLDRGNLFVLPSRTEGLPRALVEAMARGLPCVGSAVGGVPELLPEEDVVPPGDANALAAKIQDVLADRDRLERMAARNLEFARQFREDLLEAQRLAFYEELRRVCCTRSQASANAV